MTFLGRMRWFGGERPGQERQAQRPGKRTRRHSRPAVEDLEGRALLTGSGATIFQAGGMIQVLGTNLGDTGSFRVDNGSVRVHVENSQGSDDIAFPAAGVSMVFFIGGAGNDNFRNDTSLFSYMMGGGGDNTLTGGPGSDTLIATGAGTQTLNAGGGYDTLMAFGPGTNYLNGGSGSTTIMAYAGNNVIRGGSGNLSVMTFGGQNSIDGGAAATTVFSFVATDSITQRDKLTVYRFAR